MSMRTLTSSSSGGECRNPSLGLVTKAKGLQGCEPRGSPGVKAKALQRCGPKGSRGVTSHTPGKNSHLDVASMESCTVYYKGEGGGFPQVWAMVSLVCPCCPWLVLAPRVLQLCTNHFVWVVCRLV